MTYRAKAYPYPVLSTFSSDYDGQPNFAVRLDVALSDDEEQAIAMTFDVDLSSPWLAEYIVDRKAALYLDVESRSTLYREYHHLESFVGELTFRGGDLFGSILATPLIVATEDNWQFRPDPINVEFGAGVFPVRRGDILAIGAAAKFDLEFERTLDRNLLTIQYLPDANEQGLYRFDYTGARIMILAGDNLRKPISFMRSDASLQPYLFLSVYKDCLAGALLYLAENGNEADDPAWARTLRRQLAEMHRDIVPGDREYNETTAQMLVRTKGFGALETQVDR